MKTTKKDKIYLETVVKLASNTFKHGNHPCGCLIVNSISEVISESGNKVFSTPDITAHAEILCIRNAGHIIMDKRSSEVFTLYSSHEPCCGCAFFIARTQIKKVVYACRDRYRPGISMLKNNSKFDMYFKDIELIEEPFLDLRDKSASLMNEYFLLKNKTDKANYFNLDFINKGLNEKQ